MHTVYSMFIQTYTISSNQAQSCLESAAKLVDREAKQVNVPRKSMKALILNDEGLTQNH